MPDRFDAYKVLQVDPEADVEVIQAAYRRLAQKYHPDVGAAGGVAAERMIALNRAWELVRDPKRRAAYDLERRAAGSQTRTPDGTRLVSDSSGAKRPFTNTSVHQSAAPNKYGVRSS